MSWRYRGRLAPSPTGFLHLGHARTFWTAYQRARVHQGTLVFRNEDLDRARCKPEFVRAMMEDLTWFGLQWEEGPDRGGPFGPYNQSQRQAMYRAAFDILRTAALIYPCTCSRQDVLRALRAPQAGEDEPIYPGTCRPRHSSLLQPATESNPEITWRFRVPDGEPITFVDGLGGLQQFIAGQDFGDFVVWRHDDYPSYQLAVVVDDAAMRISEVVRGVDLLRSTARQLLLYRALGQKAPAFYHCPLLTDSSGVRLAKRNNALSLSRLRADGAKPEDLRANWPAADSAPLSAWQ